MRRALEERAHNLTRLPYELGENIQVVRYKEGQKYGAHRDFFNPNDYHRQPSMLRSVEYGARNRMATGEQPLPIAEHMVAAFAFAPLAHRTLALVAASQSSGTCRLWRRAAKRSFRELSTRRVRSTAPRACCMCVPAAMRRHIVCAASAAAGREYHPWNGDHEDCYRGLYVKPEQGNAVLFYSMVPDGRC